MAMERIKGGERPSRPPNTTRLGLSGGLWVVIQSLLVHEAEKRPPVSAFVEWLDAANPSIAALEDLTKFDPNSEGDIRNLRHMFRHRDNTLFGMREKETLVVIEVFNRVSCIARQLSFVSTPLIPGSQLLVERFHSPQSMFTRASEGLRPMWPSTEEPLDLPQ